MSQTVQTINSCLENIRSNRKTLEGNKARIQTEIGTVTDDVQSAIDLLVAKIGGGEKTPVVAQKIGQIINGQLQLASLVAHFAELDVLEATLSVVASDDGLLEIAEEQQRVNQETRNNPLPPAGGDGQSTSAAEGAGTDAATGTAQDSGAAAPSGSDQGVNEAAAA